MFKKNRLPRRGEKGFTLIELLVVVAILGVLAAVVVPNVTRFMGSGKTQAGETELHNVQLAVGAMMADQGLTSLSATNLQSTITTPCNDMTKFPFSDGTHALNGDATHGNYIQKTPTNYWYTVSTDGTVRGWWSNAGSGGTAGHLEIGVDPAP